MRVLKALRCHPEAGAFCRRRISTNCGLNPSLAQDDTHKAGRWRRYAQCQYTALDAESPIIEIQRGTRFEAQFFGAHRVAANSEDVEVLPAKTFQSPPETRGANVRQRCERAMVRRVVGVDRLSASLARIKS